MEGWNFSYFGIFTVDMSKGSVPSVIRRKSSSMAAVPNLASLTDWSFGLRSCQTSDTALDRLRGKQREAFLKMGFLCPLPCCCQCGRSRFSGSSDFCWNSYHMGLHSEQPMCLLRTSRFVFLCPRTLTCSCVFQSGGFWKGRRWERVDLDPMKS